MRVEISGEIRFIEFSCLAVVLVKYIVASNTKCRRLAFLQESQELYLEYARSIEDGKEIEALVYG